jgi:predicted thioesterase
MIAVGDRAELSFTVGEADTARALGSGDVAVLATPRALAWLEAATVAAVAAALDPAETTVGTEVELSHLLPTPIGARVAVTAMVREVAGRRVTFQVAATNPDGATALRGQIVRARVARSRFQ